MSELYSIAVVLWAVCATAACVPTPQQKTTNDGQKHGAEVDHYATGLVENPKIRDNYLKCFLDKGPCSPEARNIKQMVPEAIKKECAHCTELQRKVIEKMMCYLNNHQPEILKQVAAKFDPKGDYMKTYIQAIEQKRNEHISTNSQQQQPQQNQQQPQQNIQKSQQNQQQSQKQQSKSTAAIKDTAPTTPKV